MTSLGLKNARRKIQDAMARNDIDTLGELHRIAKQTLKSRCSHMHYRRPFNDDYTGAPNIAVIIEMAFVAGCSKDEIIDIARGFGDKLWPQLIAPDLPHKERTALKVINDMTSADNSIWTSISDSFGILCRAVGLNRDKELQQLKE